MSKHINCILLILGFHFVCAQNVITLKTAIPGAKIDKNIYGQFAEHLGHLIYGGLYVGEKDAIPNSSGIRNDIIAALIKLKVPILRWPGGCFADTYHWKDGIGPHDKRPTIVNTNWGGVTEDNSFGTHDFLNFCKAIGAEPYISGNVGSGSVQELADWVQYVNFNGVSPMSDMRKVNGQDIPWNVRFWGIGNEAWGCGGNMTAEHYTDVYRTYVTFMQNVSNTHIFPIASGASDNDYHWTETIMKNIPLHMIGGIALHHYSVIDWNHKGSSTQFSEEEYFATMKKAWQMEELVTNHSRIMDKYDSLRKIALVVDEWGGWYDVEPGTNPGFLYQQNTLRDAMIAGLTLNIFNNHCNRVRIANLAQMVNVLQAVILTSKEKIILTPTYHVMEMFNVHQNAQMIPVEITSTDYKFKDEKLPSFYASASRDTSGRIHISIVNINYRNKMNINLKVEGSHFQIVSGRILTSQKIQDHNTFEEPEKVKPVIFTSFTINKTGLNVQMPPFSVVVLELK